MNKVRTEIEQLEKALNVVARHPKLIRPGYWMSQIEGLLGQTELSAQDRQCVQALRDAWTSDARAFRLDGYQQAIRPVDELGRRACVGLTVRRNKKNAAALFQTAARDPREFAIPGKGRLSVSGSFCRA